MELNLITALLKYSYLQNAYLAGFLIAGISPFFGAFVVAKRASLIPDTIGHVSFSASTFTVLMISLGIFPPTMTPLPIVLLFAVVMSIIISYVNRYFRKAKEVALSFVMTFSLGGAIVMYQLAKSKTDLSGYLFGNIVTLTQVDIISIVVITVISLWFILRHYKLLLLTTFDVVFAQTKGIKNRSLDMLFFIMLGLIIATSTKFVGVLLVSALMNLPVMISMLFTKSFKQTIIVGIIISELSMFIGMIFAYYFDLPTSGVVAMLLGLLFLVALLTKRMKRFQD